MKTLDATQSAAVASSSLAPITLVVLTTYTDKGAGDVDTIYRFSTRSIDYPYGAAGDQFFAPWLQGIGDLRSSMTHVVNGSSSGITAKTVDVDLFNSDQAGTRVAATLQGHTLEGASIEISQLLVASRSKGVTDLTALTGDEHTIIFSGEVARFLVNNNTITLSCETVIPFYKWPSVTIDTDAAERDVGIRYPMAIGSGIQVQCPALKIGPTLTLGETITSGQTGLVDFTGIDSRIPTEGYFRVRIGTEELRCYYESATQLTINARAAASTSAAAHQNGDTALVMLGDTIFVAHAQENATVSKVEVLSSNTRQLIVITGYTVLPSYPDGSDTVTAIRFDESQVRSLLSITGASAGTVAEIQIFATVDGQVVPGAYALSESFDAGTYSTLNCATALNTSTPDPEEGTGYRTLTLDMDTEAGSELFQTETTTNWSGTNCTVSIQSGEGHRLGSNCIRGRSDSSSLATLSFSDGTISEDVEDDGTNGRKLLMFDIKIKKNGSGSSGTVILRMGHNSSNTVGITTILVDWAEDTWYTFFLDYTNSGAFETGTPNYTDIDYFSVQFNQADGVANMDVFVDNIKTVRTKHVIQNNAVGGTDMTAADDLYRLAVYREGPLAIPLIKDFGSDPAEMVLGFQMLITDEIETGTVKPAVYRQLDWLERDMPVDAWSDMQPIVSDTGVPDLTDIVTVRVEITNTLCGAYVRDPIFVWNIDNLRHADESLNLWDDATGTLIEQPHDVARFWLQKIAGFTIHEASFTTAATNLGANVLAGDMRGWGASWMEVLDHLAVLARGNFVPEETSTGLQWKLLVADSSYGWPVSDRTLDQFQDSNFSEGGRDKNSELRSARSFLYDYRPSITDVEGYAKVVRISSDENQSGGAVSAATITAAVAAFGEAEADPQFLLGIGEEATAQEVAGYYYTEGARIASLFLIEGLSWSQGYDLELGDIVDAVRPWFAGTVKMRVIELEKSFRTERVNVRAVEVA